MEIGTSSTFIRPSLERPKSEDPYDVLQAVLDDSIFYSGKRAFWFGILYYGLRTALIVLSACAAAKGINFLQENAAPISLLVAIGTAVDTWLQPGIKYKAHYTYNDKFRALKTDLYLVKRDDAGALKSINESWKMFDDDYRKTVLPI